MITYSSSSQLLRQQESKIAYIYTPILRFVYMQRSQNLQKSAQKNRQKAGKAIPSQKTDLPSQKTYWMWLSWSSLWLPLHCSAVILVDCNLAIWLDGRHRINLLLARPQHDGPVPCWSYIRGWHNSRCLLCPRQHHARLVPFQTLSFDITRWGVHSPGYTLSKLKWKVGRRIYSSLWSHNDMPQ